MTPERFARLKEAVLTARRLAETDREPYLDGALGDDPDLRREARSLLASYERPGGPVAPAGAARFLVAGADGPPGSEAAMPDRIGPYRILGVLGEGGMGVVYHAEQDEPFHREVAVKVIRTGMATGPVLARFSSERETLARLEHSGIARVLDAGTDGSGTPWFSMELVRGSPLDDWIRDAAPSRRELVGMLLRIARAVEHAHRRGVVHRDLKPSNVLVATEDGEPVPKIIDFGIAKAIAEPLLPFVTRTREGEFMGTPEFMSPEQLDGAPEDVGPASDVYSLGVVAYRMLTGAMPYELPRTSLVRLARVICEQPPRPPRRVHGTANPLDGDLATILMKCLEKRPERRYADAGDLADDLDRYLRSLPIRARRPGPLYRFRKHVTRRAARYVATGSIVLVAGTLAIAWGPLRRNAPTRVVPSFFFHGMLDEIAIFDRALSAGEVVAIAEARSGFCGESRRDPDGCRPPPAGLVAYWPGDDTAEDTRGAHSGAGRNGAGYGEGVSGRAFRFDGRDDYVEIPDDPAWAFGDRDFSIVLWARFESRPVSGAILIGNDEGPGEVDKWILIYQDGYLSFSINGPLIPPTFLAPAPLEPVLGRWIHVAVTRKGTLYSIYLDGELTATDVNALAVPDATAPLTIGQAESVFRRP